MSASDGNNNNPTSTSTSTSNPHLHSHHLTGLSSRLPSSLTSGSSISFRTRTTGTTTLANMPENQGSRFSDTPNARTPVSLRGGGNFEMGVSSPFASSIAPPHAVPSGDSLEAGYRVNLPPWRTGPNAGPLSSTLRFGSPNVTSAAPARASSSALQGQREPPREEDRPFLPHYSPRHDDLDDRSYMNAAGAPQIGRSMYHGLLNASTSARAGTRGQGSQRVGVALARSQAEMLAAAAARLPGGVPFNPQSCARCPKTLQQGIVNLGASSFLVPLKYYLVPRWIDCPVPSAQLPPTFSVPRSLFTFTPSSYDDVSIDPSISPYSAFVGLPIKDFKMDFVKQKAVAPNSMFELGPSSEVGDRGGLIGLPTCWDREDRCALLEVDKSGKELRFLGTGQNGDRDAAAVRTNRPMPPQCGIYYFEVEILSKGLSGFIGIGFCALRVSLSRLPGWEEQSWGYHGDDGHVFSAQGTGKKYGPTFTTGDVIGCGIDWTLGKAFFVKNGVSLGYVFSDIKGELYPTAGLRTPGEALKANFGDVPFRFDIEGFVRARKQSITSEIARRPLPRLLGLSNRATEADVVGGPPAPADAQDDAPETISSLITSYLLHHGYTDTARALEAQQARERLAASGSSVSDSDLAINVRAEEEDVKARQRIRAAILRGDITFAIAETKSHYPRVLEDEDRNIRFKLRLQEFVELVIADAANRERNPEPDGVDMELDEPVDVMAASGTSESMPRAALDCGQTLFSDYAGVQSVERLLRVASSLLAYEDPTKATGEAGKLASAESRIALADDLNGAILASQGRPTRPFLETLYRHTLGLLSALGKDGTSAFVSINEF